MWILFSFSSGLFIVFGFAYVCHKLSHGIFVHTLLYFIIKPFTLFSPRIMCLEILAAFFWISLLGFFFFFDGRAAAVDVSFNEMPGGSIARELRHHRRCPSRLFKNFKCQLLWQVRKSVKILQMNADKRPKRSKRPERTDEGHRCVWVTLRRRPRRQKKKEEN